MSATFNAWPDAAEFPATSVAAEDAAGFEPQSLYSSATWLAGKKVNAPPIFTSIGFRHPQCYEYDAKIREQGSSEAILALTNSELRRFDAGNVVNALAALPKVCGPRGLEQFQRHPGWLDLQDRIRGCINRLEPRGLSMVAYSMARLGWRDSKLISAVVEGTERRIIDFGATDIAKVSWTLAKMCIVDRTHGIWALLAKEGTRKCCNGSFIDISMLAWAFAAAGVGDRGLFGQIATATCDRRDELPPQTISNLAWAFAKANIKNEQLFDVLAERSIECAAEFDRQGVSNTLWAFAKLGIAHEGVFEALIRHVVDSSLWRKLSPQMVSNLLWACSRVGVTDVPLFETIAEYIKQHASSFDNQNIANIAWAYSMAQLPSKTVYDTLANVAMERLSSFRLDELCGLFSSFARAKVPGCRIFEAAVDVLMPRAAQLDAQGLSNVLWVLATVGHLNGAPVPGSRELVDKLLAMLLDLRVRLDSEGAAMTVWALWRMGRFHDAWTLYARTLSDGRHPPTGKPSGRAGGGGDGRQQYFQVLLMESERRGDVSKQAYLWKQMMADTFARTLRSAFLNSAILGLMNRGDREDALELIKQLVRTKLDSAVTHCLARRLGLRQEDLVPAESIENMMRRRPQHASRFEDMHHREIGLLDALLLGAQPGDAQAARAVMEDFIFQAGLRVSGGEKSCILDNTLQRHQPKLVLEYGAYVGYTTTWIGLQVKAWGGRVVSLEMDPINAAVSRNVIEFCGLSDVARVQLGHSDDSADLILEEYGKGSVHLVFMDQRGTRFHSDLQRLEALGVLANPCIVIADNVLNPGAPLHVWRVCSMPHYVTNIISLHKFGLTAVRDWVTISVLHQGETYGQESEENRELVSLARRTDRFRWKAKSIPRSEMAGEPTDMQNDCFEATFARLGIVPSLAVATALDGEGGASSWLVTLRPGDKPPLWEKPELHGLVKGGRWRSIVRDPEPAH